MPAGAGQRGLPRASGQRSSTAHTRRTGTPCKNGSFSAHRKCSSSGAELTSFAALDSGTNSVDWTDLHKSDEWKHPYGESHVWLLCELVYPGLLLWCLRYTLSAAGATWSTYARARGAVLGGGEGMGGRGGGGGPPSYYVVVGRPSSSSSSLLSPPAKTLLKIRFRPLLTLSCLF